MWFDKRLILFFIFLIEALMANCQDYPFKETDRDPFFPLVSEIGQLLIQQKVKSEDLVLKGLVCLEKGCLAVIGDKILKENEKIGDYIIVKIGKRCVVLKRENKKIILKLGVE